MITLCFFLSGFSALLYQIAWFRQFSLLFGTSEYASVIVLAGYMAGLAVGAAAIRVLMDRIVRPVMVYAFLEGGIALWAILLPLLLQLAQMVFLALFGGQASPPSINASSQLLFYFAVSLAVLLVPTALMGATLPLLVRQTISSREEIATGVSLLYGLNTAGAACGTIATGFFLLPQFGLSNTVYFGAFINVGIFLIAAVLSKGSASGWASKTATWQTSGREVPKADSFRADSSQPLPQSWLLKTGSLQRTTILPLIAISGCVSFLYEILWTRLLSHVLGSSVQAFSTMLATFLIGIAIGGGAIGKLTKHRVDLASMFAATQFAIAIFSIATYSLIDHLLPDVASASNKILFCAFVMLPSTICIGFTFPMAVRMLSSGVGEVVGSTAKVYTWNTLGGIAGAVLTGLFFIPWLGFNGVLKIAAISSAVLAMVSLFGMAKSHSKQISLVAIVLFAVILIYQPDRPAKLLHTSLVDEKLQVEQERFYKTGITSTVLMLEGDGEYFLRTNGLPEASVPFTGSPPFRNSQKWLAALPIAARPQASTLLLVGLGAGTAIEDLPPSISQIDVMEIEPEVVRALQSISPWRESDPLEDPRVNVIINDARNGISLTAKSYDIIVSQPSHPWTSGASHLYTKEFMSLAREHLSADGIYVQWINTEFLSLGLLKSMAATLLSEFKFVEMYRPTTKEIIFLASQSDLVPETNLLAEPQLADRTIDYFSSVGINSRADLKVALAAETEGLRIFSGNKASISDDRNALAMHRFQSGSEGIDERDLFSAIKAYDPLLLDVQRSKASFLLLSQLPYIGSELIQLRFLPKFAGLLQSLEGSHSALLLEAIAAISRGNNAQAEKLLESIPESNGAIFRQAAYLRAKMHASAIATSNESASIRDLRNGLSGSLKAVLDGWALAYKRQWQALAELEGRLAESLPTDLWYSDAIQLRAEWRTKLDTRQVGLKYVQEAMELLDKALIIRPSTDLYVLRAGCAYLMDEPLAFMETAAQVARLVAHKQSLALESAYVYAGVELQTDIMRIDGMLSVFRSEFGKQLEPQRSAQVARNLSALSASLAQLSP